MDRRRAFRLLIVCSLFAVAAGGRAEAAPSAPAGHSCATLMVLLFTSSISAAPNTVPFLISAPSGCSWIASSTVLQSITPAQGAGNASVTGQVGSNPSAQSRAVVLTVRSTDNVVTRTATVTQAAPVFDCTGVTVSPTSLWTPGGFISVSVPAGWTWYWNPLTQLMQYNCTPNYPTGVSCSWGCFENRVGTAEVIAYGQGYRCVRTVSGYQNRCDSYDALCI